MGASVTTAQEEIPQAGSLVEVRGQRWVVGEEPVPGRQGSTLLTLQSVEDGRYGESLPVIWEVEPGRRILPRRSLPEVARDDFDPPERLAAALVAYCKGLTTKPYRVTVELSVLHNSPWDGIDGYGACRWPWPAHCQSGRLPASPGRAQRP
jgi:hypothetical protein